MYIFFVVVMVKMLSRQIAHGWGINNAQFIINRSAEDGEYTDKEPEELEARQDKRLKSKADGNDEHDDRYDDRLDRDDQRPLNRQYDADRYDDRRSDYDDRRSDRYDDGRSDRYDDRRNDRYDDRRNDRYDDDRRNDRRNDYDDRRSDRYDDRRDRYGHPDDRSRSPNVPANKPTRG